MALSQLRISGKIPNFVFLLTDDRDSLNQKISAPDDDKFSFAKQLEIFFFMLRCIDFVETSLIVQLFFVGLSRISTDAKSEV